MGNQPLQKSIGCQTEPNTFLEKQSIVSKVYRTCYFGDNTLTKTNSIVFNFSKRENYYIILKIKDTIFNYTKFSGSIKLLRNNGVFLQELKFTDEYIIDDNNKKYEICLIFANNAYITLVTEIIEVTLEDQKEIN